MEQKQGKLYLVATPIGNLEDITYRAVRTLSEVDIIAAEDTRHSLKLLNHLEIRKPLISYHDNNRLTRGTEIIDKLKSGQNVALISDAGMPAISDPGEELVRLCIEEGIEVTAIPGCSASLTGLILSGLPANRFAFEGFLPQKHGDRVKMLERLKTEERTMIFYEGPHRVKKMLTDIREVLGNRPCALARELTKLHEEILRGSIEDLINHFTAHDPRGEFVVIVEGSSYKTPELSMPDDNPLSISEHMEKYQHQGLDRMEAMKRVAKDRGLTKRDIYQALHQYESD